MGAARARNEFSDRKFLEACCLVMSITGQNREPHWLNKKQMAASLRITPQAFDFWGVKPVARIGREAFFEVADVAEAIKRRLDSADVDRSESYAAERYLLARRRREKIELELQKARGELLPTGLVAAVQGKFTAAFRAKTLAIPSRAAPELVDLETAAKIQQRLKEFVYEALSELAEFRPEDYGIQVVENQAGSEE